MGWSHRIASALSFVERRVDRWRYGKQWHIRRKRPIRIEAYRGYAGAERALVMARILDNPPLARAGRTDSAWKNLLSMLRRLETDELPHARVEIEFPDGAVHQAMADEEGHVRAWLPAARAFDPARSWHDVAIRIQPTRITARPHSQFSGIVRVLTAPASARFGIVSDIDDTVIRTDATSVTAMLRGTLLGNAHTRIAFAGGAELYRALHAGARGNEANPFFYVSSSPWNLYDVLEHVFELHGLPEGPLLLRNWGISDQELLPTGHRLHKLETIAHILETFPALPFVLIGDSGQEDPEIYDEIVRRHGERIRAVYIRNVTPAESRAADIRALGDRIREAGSVLILADDSHAAAEHAAEHGLIDPQHLPAIYEKIRQEKEPGERAPTVIVEGEAS